MRNWNVTELPMSKALEELSKSERQRTLQEWHQLNIF